MANEPRRGDQRSCAGLHTIDGCFNIFMFDFPHGQRRKGAMSLVPMRLNMPFITCQDVLDALTMLVAEDVFERSYLFVAAYPQNVRHLFRFVHPTRANGGNDT